MEVDEDNQRPKLALELNFLRDRLRFQSVRFSIFVSNVALDVRVND